MSLDLNELRDLLAAINQTDISELTLKSSEFELIVRRGQSVAVSDPLPLVAAPLPVIASPPPAASGPAAAPPPAVVKNDRCLEITSPIVGTFYRAPSPDDPPFVSPGDRIKVGQTVCIIEAMKVMNELEAEVMGEIVEILVENAQPVEFGQVLMRVNPG